MKKYIILGLSASLLLMSSCVEKSQKYKDLKSKTDSLTVIAAERGHEIEEILADVNDITAGMQSLREAENLLTLETEKELKGSKTKQQLIRLKSDIAAINEALVSYRAQIKKLEGKNKAQSAEFKRMIANLNAELEQRSQKIDEITNQLVAANKELAVKVEEIKGLTHNVDSLGVESKTHKLLIAEQDQTIHQANYLVGTRRELKDAEVISRQGIFCPPIVSSQVKQADFIKIDIRETKSILLNAKKAKVLSSHPTDSYILETDADGNLVLKINDEMNFWRQTKYLVVMIG